MPPSVAQSRCATWTPGPAPALGASGLPPGNGFVSEWLLLQGLIHSLAVSSAPDVAVAIVMPLAVGAVALTAGLGVALFVKAFGVGFLARPRSAEAARAREVPRSMHAGMVLAAVSCALLALAPLALIRSLERVLVAVPSIGDKRQVHGVVKLQMSGIAGSMSPILIALGLAGGTLLITFLAHRLGGRQPRRTALIWGCGGTRLSPRMQYTATAYAEPLTRVFDDVLRPEHDIDITHHVGSRSWTRRCSTGQRFPSRWWTPSSRTSADQQKLQPLLRRQRLVSSSSGRAAPLAQLGGHDGARSTTRTPLPRPGGRIAKPSTIRGEPYRPHSLQQSTAPTYERSS